MTSSLNKINSIKEDGVNEKRLLELLQLTDSKASIGATFKYTETRDTNPYRCGLNITIFHRGQLRNCYSSYDSKSELEAYDTVLQDAIKYLVFFYHKITEINEET